MRGCGRMYACTHARLLGCHAGACHAPCMHAWRAHDATLHRPPFARPACRQEAATEGSRPQLPTSSRTQPGPLRASGQPFPSPLGAPTPGRLCGLPSRALTPGPGLSHCDAHAPPTGCTPPLPSPSAATRCNAALRAWQPPCSPPVASRQLTLAPSPGCLAVGVSDWRDWNSTGRTNGGSIGIPSAAG